MKVNRIDHIGINVEDLSAAKEFFVDFGLEVQGEADMEGQLLDNVTALDNAKTRIVMLGTSDGETSIELVKYYAPTDDKGIQPFSANTLGIRHIAFAVEDIDAMVARLKQKGAELFSEIQNYENIYKLCYIRGPEGIILELAEDIRSKR